MAEKKFRILVVEDNAALSGVICFNLFRAGYQVTNATNGQQGLEIAQKEKFDLVLSDQQMPMMTGVQLCESLRQLAGYRQTPFILLTAKCMEINLVELQRTVGISTALPKPFSPSELIIGIEELLAAGCRA
ncbi:MAG: response regulator [Planctomycetes bacterium]|nr:response regulator [Planctomycetota bacterium]